MSCVPFVIGIVKANVINFCVIFGRDSLRLGTRNS